jgi:hypothetical protein
VAPSLAGAGARRESILENVDTLTERVDRVVGDGALAEDDHCDFEGAVPFIS